MSKVGIIGWGVVGQAVGKGFALNGQNEVFWWDKYQKGPFELEDVINNSEFIFLCVPTPMFADYSGIDLSIVEEVVDQIAPKIANTDKVLVIKSTVVPGTTAHFAKKYPDVNFAMNPEFLSEISAAEDFLHPDKIVIGAMDENIASSIARLHRSVIPREGKVFLTDTTTAELAKYMHNMLGAMKITFANEIYELAQNIGINYDEVKKIVGSDPRHGEALLSVTSFRGFGGKCFPKDTVALLSLYKKLGVDSTLLSAMWDKNLKVRKVRDWEKIEGAVRKKR